MRSLDIAPARLLNQLLGEEKCKTPDETVAWLGAVQSQDFAAAKWTLRYFASHGPAQLKDFVWWSGLTSREGQRGLDLAAPQLAYAIIDGNTYWFSPNTKTIKAKVPAALLLSIYDEYAIAYKDRSALGGELPCVLD